MYPVAPSADLFTLLATASHQLFDGDFDDYDDEPRLEVLVDKLAPEYASLWLPP